MPCKPESQPHRNLVPLPQACNDMVNLVSFIRKSSFETFYKVSHSVAFFFFSFFFFFFFFLCGGVVKGITHSQLGGAHVPFRSPLAPELTQLLNILLKVVILLFLRLCSNGQQFKSSNGMFRCIFKSSFRLQNQYP